VARSAVLLCYALGMMTGNLVSGQLASLAQRRGIEPMLVPYSGMVVIAGMQLVLMLAPPSGLVPLQLLWFGFAFSGSCGPAAYALVAQRFPPALVGRVATALNGSMLLLVFLLQNLIGVVLDQFPQPSPGHWNPTGYSWAMGLTLALEALTVAWLVLAPRPKSG
jgi:MFS family permease